MNCREDGSGGRGTYKVNGFRGSGGRRDNSGTTFPHGKRHQHGTLGYRGVTGFCGRFYEEGTSF